ncbi:MAG: VPLPA-CTERM sorting domain-containing protein [Pseudomonadota bacterium]
MKLRTQVSTGIAILGAAMASAQADVVFTFTQSGGNVLMQSSGVLNTANLVAAAASGWGGTGVETNGGGQSDIMGDTSMGGINRGFGFNTGTNYAPWIGNMFMSSNFAWSSAGTTQFTTYLMPGGFRTPGIGISAADMVGALWTPDVSWSKAGTLASLGLTMGTYTITDIQTQESITIQIGESTRIPEPASIGLLGLGLAGLALARRRRQA